MDSLEFAAPPHRERGMETPFTHHFRACSSCERLIIGALETAWAVGRDCPSAYRDAAGWHEIPVHDQDLAHALAERTDVTLIARQHVRRLSRLSDLSPEEEAVLRLPCFAALGWNEPYCYTPAERSLVLALARHARLLPEDD